MAHDIRVLDMDGVRTAVDWAAREGWNPGFGDAEAFAAADATGFLGLHEGGELAAIVSIVSYGPAFAFLGFYIARPQSRGRGLGLALWNHALAHCGAATVGLDGVKAQQPNYRKSGFVFAHENIRHGGLKPAGFARQDPSLSPLTAADAEEVSRFEQRHRLFPAPRSRFLAGWLAREALALRRGGEIAGYGVIRRCREGCKVGPLFAATAEDAETILRGLLTRAPEGMIFLDVPGTNQDAVSLALSLKLEPIFETARMYRGPAPDLDTGSIFGITSFELG